MSIKDSYLGQAWLVLVLAACFGGALAGVEIALRDRIAQNKLEETLGQIPKLVPGAEGGEPMEIDGYTVFAARSANGRHVGWVVKATGLGFADRIELLIGLDREAGKITGLWVLEQKETPNLGSRITEDAFRAPFAGGKLSADGDVSATTETPGAENEIAAISGATISSRSVCAIVNRALRTLQGTLAEKARALAAPATRPGATQPGATRPSPAGAGDPPGSVRIDRHRFYPDRDEADRLTGWYVRTSGEGFIGPIQVLVRVDRPAERITGLWVLSHEESPDYNAHQIAGADFRRPFFSGRMSARRPVVVAALAPAGANEIPNITGATVTAESVCQIINRALRAVRGELARRARDLEWPQQSDREQTLATQPNRPGTPGAETEGSL